MEVIHTGPFGVNTYIVNFSDRDVFIVDPACSEYCGDSEVVIKYLESHALEPKAILLTHGHFDHVAGLKVLKERYPAIKIHIHEKDACFIGKDSGKTHGIEISSFSLSDFLPFLSNLPEPDVVLKDEMVLFDSWKVMHTPGHTKGSCCFYNEAEKILISGDTLFYGTWGRTDFYGGSDESMKKSLQKIFDAVSPDAKVYPGHDYYGFLLKDSGI